MSKKGKHCKAHSAAASAQCTNHYTRSVMQLEGVVEERLSQLNLLAQENALLKRREAALQSACGSLAGSLSAAAKAVMASSATDTADDAQAAPDLSASFIPCSIPDHKRYLMTMQLRDTAVQHVMSQLGDVESKELYSSWLLKRAFSDPARAAAHLAMSRTERVTFLLSTVQKLGVLLGKYDLPHQPRTTMGTPREQLDQLVDNLNEHMLVFCLLAPPNRQLETACYNMDAGQPEPYPAGWWAVVINAMQLQDEQKSALKVCWDKVKSIKLALMAKYEVLSNQLAALQRKQWDQHLQYELQAELAVNAAILHKAAEKQQNKQQQQPGALQADVQAASAREQQQVLGSRSLPGQQQHGSWQPQQMQHDDQQQHMLPPTLQAGASPPGPACRSQLNSELSASKSSTPAAVLHARAAEAKSPCDEDTVQQRDSSSLGSHASPCISGGDQHLAFEQRHQEQVYPLQKVPSRQFLHFTPVVAAATALADEDFWLQGLAPELGDQDSNVHPQEHRCVDRAGCGPCAQTAPDDADDMLVDDDQQLDSTTHNCKDGVRRRHSCYGAFMRSESHVQSASCHSDVALADVGAAATSQKAAQTGLFVKRSISDVHPPMQPWTNVDAEGGAVSSFVRSPLVHGLGGGSDERKLERQLDLITAQLKMQQYCMHTYVLNICSKKQIALKYITCYPWVPESFSMCEALDESGW